ncbi:hypothetical protein Sgleb_24480 [Streptomyces glebosus]|uniref:Clp R domain-containing protein n=1 Tax=Streptomyces glebosus TaxID=249580 RepID=A0A640SVS6_9ACTN|nr:hypothetical protein [Streptomyces glebosus]GFE14401.1 hypothetical protein Sgleb_24480 [Streptomyces glebosus]GHG55288.1 hypothetical protein GCM10010513_17310 [Streptomyces glebosus]
MFEKFTAGARAVVRGAVEQADRTGSGAIGEPELLLALLERTDSPAAGVLAALGVHERRESVADALAQVRRRGGVSTADAAAPAGMGIDIAAPLRARPYGWPTFTLPMPRVLCRGR